MIKRVFTIFFLLTFSLATTGLIITSHHCDMEKCGTEKNCCNEKSNDCCTSNSVFLKLKNDFRSNKYHKLEFHSFSTTLFTFINHSEKRGFIQAEVINIGPSHPEIISSDSFLQVFKI